MMGMYTGLYFKALIKEEYRGMVRLAIDHSWYFAGNHYPVARNWSSVGRCESIPWGALCYMPDDFPDQCCDIANGVWEVSCSLKNYQGEIQTFIKDVLSVISEEVYECFSLYEEYPTESWKDSVQTYFENRSSL
jgi:hypothetical protein